MSTRFFRSSLVYLLLWAILLVPSVRHFPGAHSTKLGTASTQLFQRSGWRLRTTDLPRFAPHRGFRTERARSCCPIVTDRSIAICQGTSTRGTRSVRHSSEPITLPCSVTLLSQQRSGYSRRGGNRSVRYPPDVEKSHTAATWRSKRNSVMLTLNRRRLVIGNSLGFHLRAAGKFASLAQQFQADIRVYATARKPAARALSS